MTGGCPNLELSDNDKSRMESVPSLISATAGTAEAPKLSFFPSFGVGDNVAVPVLQSRPGQSLCYMDRILVLVYPTHEI